MFRPIFRRTILLICCLIFIGAAVCGCGKAIEMQVAGDSYFFNVHWGDTADTIKEKAGEPARQDANFLEYDDVDFMGVPCDVVLVVDFSYSYPGLYSVTHTFLETPDLVAIRKTFTAAYGAPLPQVDDTLVWQLKETTIYLSADRVSFMDTGK